MTFHSLYRLERRGLLTARSWAWRSTTGRSTTCASAPASRSRTAASRSTTRCSTASPRGSRTSRATSPTRPPSSGVAKAISGARSPVFYLEIPPFLFGTVIKGLAEAGLTKNARVVVEKPFGHDLASARALAEEIHEYIDESQLYRIDHFLGKMGLVEILYLRFANTMFEPVWNRNYVVVGADHDGGGLRRRGPRPLLRPVGALRDVVVNHLMQVVAAAAMEPPAAGDADDAQGRAGRRLPGHARRPTRRTTCAGSTRATATIDGCADDSTTETYAALRLEIDNWRWSGVPFFIRTGKHLPVTQTELRLVFERPAAAGLPARAGPTARSRTSSWSSSTPRPASGCSSTPSAATPRRPSRSTSTWSSRRRAARAPTPYEVLLHAAMHGRQHALHPPGQRRGDLAGHAAAARRARRRCTPYAKGSWGPAAADKLVAGHGGWHGPVGGVHEPTSPGDAEAAASPPERRRAVAVPADRRLRVPLQLPHRRAGRARRRGRLALRAALRLAERVRHAARPRGRRPSGSGRSASTSRRPASTSPGRTPLLTTWKTPTGWILVRDALTMGPRRGEDEITPHTRPPADDDGDHMLVRTVLCLDGQRRGRAGLRAGLRLRPRAGRVDAGRTATATRPTRRGAGQTIRLQTDMAIGIEGDRVRARHVARAGRPGLLLALLGRGPGRAAGRRRGQRAARRHDALLARLARARPPARPPLARARSSARRWRSRASPTCRPARPWRRSPPRCPRRPAASATGTTATPGCATRPSRSRRCTSSTSTGRPTSSCSSSPTSSPTRTARCRSCTGSTAAATSPSPRATTSPATRARSPVRIGNGAFDQRQNDVFGAVLDSILLHTRRSQRLPRRLWPIVQSQAECATEVWREPDQGIWEARGEPQHYVSSKLMCWVALDRAAKLADIRGDPELERDLERDRRRDQGGHPRARRQGRRAAPALRHRRARRLDAAGGDLRLPAGRRRAPAQERRSRSPTT